VKKAVSLGYDLFDVLFAACVHPAEHYRLKVGLLKAGDPADFIVVDNLTDFTVLKTVINGEVVAENGATMLPPRTHTVVNNFHTSAKVISDFFVEAGNGKIRVIEALDGQLITRELHETPKTENGNIISDVSCDVLKLAVVNRYSNTPPAIAFIKNFGLKSGAIASSVAHDSHNIIAVGTDDESLCRAVNLLIENTGGLSLVDGTEEMVIALPVAGLMSDRDCETIGNAYTKIDKKVKAMGSTLRAPYMTLSFMALLVIPQLKLSDKGLFDGQSFRFAALNVS
jgi:adenine deaminase